MLQCQSTEPWHGHGITQNIESNAERKNTNTDIQDIPPITELNSGWTSTQDLLPRISYKDVEDYLLYSTRRTEDREKNAMLSSIY